MDHLYSKVNLTPLLDIIFIVLFLFLGSVAQREQGSLDRIAEKHEAERGRRKAVEGTLGVTRAELAEQRRLAEQLRAQNEAITAGIPRSMAAERALARQFVVYELWLDPDHWVRFKSPKGPARRLKVDPEAIRELLELRTPKERSIVLFFQSPQSIWADVVLINGVLKRGGWISQEYTLAR